MPSACRRERRNQEWAAIVHLDDVEHRDERRQFRTMGATFAWNAEVRDGRPELLPLEPGVPALPGAGLALPAAVNRGLVPNDGTLAREQVEGTDDGAGAAIALVEKRDLEQWFLRTTKYADELPTNGHRLAGARPDHARPTGSGGPKAPRSTSTWRPTTSSRAAT